MPDSSTPTDRVRLIVTDAATGEHFRLGTRAHPDKLIFTRSQTVSNAHEFEMPLEEWHRIQGTPDDLGLTAAGSHALLQVHVIIDEAAHSGGEVIAALRAELEEVKQRHADGVAALAKELDEARAQKPSGPAKSGLSEDDTACLRERDALITLLLPFIEDQENDTPVGVLSRVIVRATQASDSDSSTGSRDSNASEEEGASVQSTGSASLQPESISEAASNPTRAASQTQEPLAFQEGGETCASPEPAQAPAAEQAQPFDPAAFKASLPQDIAELRLLAAPRGIPVDGRNGQTLRKLITEDEAAKRAAA